MRVERHICRLPKQRQHNTSVTCSAPCVPHYLWTPGPALRPTFDRSSITRTAVHTPFHNSATCTSMAHSAMPSRKDRAFSQANHKNRCCCCQSPFVLPPAPLSSHLCTALTQSILQRHAAPLSSVGGLRVMETPPSPYPPPQTHTDTPSPLYSTDSK